MDITKPIRLILPKGLEVEAMRYVRMSQHSLYSLRTMVEIGKLNFHKITKSFEDGTRVVWMSAGGIDSVQVFLSPISRYDLTAAAAYATDIKERLPWYFMAICSNTGILDDVNTNVIIYSIIYDSSGSGYSLKRERTLSGADYASLLGYYYYDISGSGYQPIKIVDPYTEVDGKKVLDEDLLYSNLFVANLDYRSIIIYDYDNVMNSLAIVSSVNTIKTNYSAIALPYISGYQLVASSAIVEPVTDHSVLYWYYDKGPGIATYNPFFNWNYYGISSPIYSNFKIVFEDSYITESVYTSPGVRGCGQYTDYTTGKLDIAGLLLRPHNLYAVLELDQYIDYYYEDPHAVTWTLDNWRAGCDYIERYVHKGPIPAGGCYMVGSEDVHINYVTPPQNYWEDDGSARLSNYQQAAELAWQDAAWWPIPISEVEVVAIEMFTLDPWAFSHWAYITFPKYGIVRWSIMLPQYGYRYRIKIYNKYGQLQCEDQLPEGIGFLNMWYRLKEIYGVTLSRIDELVALRYEGVI